MARTSRLYVQLDVDFPDNAKVVEAGEQAELLYVRGLLLCKRLLSDGLLTEAQVARQALPNWRARARRLVEVGLWEEADGGWRICGWLARNASADEVAERSRRRAAAGRTGGLRSGEARQPHHPNQTGSTLLRTAEANPKHVVEHRDRDRDRELSSSTSDSRAAADSRRRPDLTQLRIGTHVDEAIGG